MRTITKPSNKRITKPIIGQMPAMSASDAAWQREVYEADPTGGAASSY